MINSVRCYRSAVFLLAIGLLLVPAKGFCDLYIQFLVDRSGSMWGGVRGTPKILMVTKTIKKLSEKLPPEIAMGLRVYPPNAKDSYKPDPGLKIPVAINNRDAFQEELVKINPKGKGPLAVHLTKALKDFPKGEDSKLLILFSDGADINGGSFCETDSFTNPENRLQFHIFSLNLKDPAEKEELNCLGKQLSGTVTHLGRNDNLLSALLPICQNAYQEEVKRQTRMIEEQRKREALQKNTRLKVEFQNSLDPFFADTIEVIEFSFNGQNISLTGPERLQKGEITQLFDQPVPKGKHRLALQYNLWREGKAIPSREGTLEVEVKEGQTSSVYCYPQGAFFHWDCYFKKDSP